MDLKDRRHRSLTRGRCSKESQFNTSSLDTDECRVPTQKSYSSSETLKAFDHEQRLHYGSCVTDLVHHEADEYPRQGNFTLAELGVCEPTPPPHPAAVPYCPDLGLLQRGYSLNAGSDADSDPEGPLSPERAIQLWARPLPPTSSSSLLPPSLPSSSSAPHHPSPGPSPPIRECQMPLLEKNSTHSHLEPHPDDSYLLR
uniref:Teneurin N-terminal domain-containing protein n=1 Tax=Monopterus albus TaxID=43700 RepID=A0A3Q3ITT9_MONAL